MSEVADGAETMLTARSGEWRASAPRRPCRAPGLPRSRTGGGPGKQRSPIESGGDLCAAARRSYLHATGSCFEIRAITGGRTAPSARKGRWVSHKRRVCPGRLRDFGMPQNFLECDREQVFLMPPDPRDWLPEGHLAWFVLASVQQLDLAAFYASYRVDGWDPSARPSRQPPVARLGRGSRTPATLPDIHAQRRLTTRASKSPGERRPISSLHSFEAGRATTTARAPAASACAPVLSTNARFFINACAAHQASGAALPGVADLRERFGDPDVSADAGGAPEGCVRSPQPSRSSPARAICESTAARRRTSCTTRPRARATRARDARAGTPLRPRIAARLGATRHARRRARSRRRQPRARTRTTRSSCAVGSPAASSTICVRHHCPRPSRSGTCATSPAACKSSSQRCTLLRCARTNRARSERSRGTWPQPITGANPTTSCSTDVANRPDRAA